jgi:hypothetical protein
MDDRQPSPACPPARNRNLANTTNPTAPQPTSRLRRGTSPCPPVTPGSGKTPQTIDLTAPTPSWMTPSSHVGQRHARACLPWSPPSLLTRVKESLTQGAGVRGKSAHERVAAPVFPNGSNLRVHGPDDLRAVEDRLNNRPRRVLGWATSAEDLHASQWHHESRTVATIARIHPGTHRR